MLKMNYLIACGERSLQCLQQKNFQKHCRSSKKFKFFDFVFKELNKESFKL